MVWENRTRSTTSIEYDQGKLVKASLEMQASRSTRVLEYMFGNDAIFLQSNPDALAAN